MEYECDFCGTLVGAEDPDEHYVIWNGSLIPVCRACQACYAMEARVFDQPKLDALDLATLEHEEVYHEQTSSLSKILAWAHAGPGATYTQECASQWPTLVYACGFSIN